MKRSALFFIVLVMSINYVLAQADIGIPHEYGKVYEVIFDPVKENVLYGRTYGNHIVTSSDKGNTWEVFYSYPLDDTLYPIIENLKVIDNGKAICFFVYDFYAYAEKNFLVIIDVETKKTKEIAIPFLDTGTYFERKEILTYDVFDKSKDVIVMQINSNKKVYYTTDGGNNWSTIHEDINFVVPEITIDPDNSDKIYMIKEYSYEETFLITQDKGETWENPLPGISVYKLGINPNDNQDMMIGTSSPAGEENIFVFRSLDGGKNWEPVSIEWDLSTLDWSFRVSSISYNPQNTGQIIVCTPKQIATSMDNGSTWEVKSIPEPNYEEDYFYGLSITHNPFNSNEFIINCDYYPFISPDAGLTLEKFKSPFFAADGTIDVVYNENSALMYYMVRSGYICRDLITNQENEHSIAPIGSYPNATITSAYADKVIPQRHFIRSDNGQTGRLYVYDGEDENYYLIGEYLTGANQIMTMDTSRKNPNIVWFSFGITSGVEHSLLLKADLSDKENIKTTIVDYPRGQNYPYIHGITIDPENENNVIITSNIDVFHTKDGGKTWENPANGLLALGNTDLILGMARNSLNPQQIAIGTSKGLYLSDDGGSNWEISLAGEVVFWTFFSPYSNGQIIATTRKSMSSMAKLFYTEDSGGNWNTIENEDLDWLLTPASTAYFRDKNNVSVLFSTSDMGIYTYNLNLKSTAISPAIGSKFSIYPNPVRDILNITSDKEISFIYIYNMNGQLIRETSSRTQVDMSGLEKGIFLLKVIFGDGNVYSGKIIKE